MSSINARVDGLGPTATSFQHERSAAESPQQNTQALLAKVEAQLEDILRMMSQSGRGPSADAHGNGHHGHQSREAQNSHNKVDAHDPSSAVSGKTSSVGTASASTPSSQSVSAATPGDHSRETLAAGHGWGAQNGGVTGGSKADKAHVFTVSTRDQLVAALGGNNATNGSNSTPKIIQIKGNIDLNADSNGKEMSKGDFANEKAQLAHDMINVGSNTTIIGIGSNAGISGGGFNVSNQHNIAVRNLNMTSPFDFFPGKDAEGNPHGRVYSIEAKGTQNLWVDHNTFKDGTTPAGAISGDQLDFTDGANYATISNNQFLSHNKSILIGSSDGMTSDKGKLNVTIDHNLFAGVSQRDPRVRFGNVDVANNLYQDSSSQANRFQYNLGVGVDSNITSQNNAFETNGVSAQSLVKRFGDSGHLTDSGSLVNGKSVDLSSSPTGKGPGAGGIAHLDATDQVASIVLAQAGAGKIGLGD
jgi:pectate lyase